MFLAELEQNRIRNSMHRQKPLVVQTSSYTRVKLYSSTCHPVTSTRQTKEKIEPIDRNWDNAADSRHQTEPNILSAHRWGRKKNAKTPYVAHLILGEPTSTGELTGRPVRRLSTSTALTSFGVFRS